MAPFDFDAPEYSPLKSAVKGLGSAAIALGAAKLAQGAQRSGIPIDQSAMLVVSAGLFGALRNLLKTKLPRFFGWLP